MSAPRPPYRLSRSTVKKTPRPGARQRRARTRWPMRRKQSCRASDTSAPVGGGVVSFLQHRTCRPHWLGQLCAISRREQVQQDSPEKTPPNLFNNLVGQREQLVRHGQAKCLGGRQIDYQIELGWLLDRKVAGLGAA
jgi:hypothetical protein